MAKKRGRCPSLISGTHGAPKLEITKGKRTCRRCNSKIPKGMKCISVPIPGSMGKKVYCHICMQEIITQTRNDLNAFENDLNSNCNLQTVDKYQDR